jgi:hypothetical protein
MEGFSMPWFTKRTASLPSPHHTGLQSHCSALPGSLPLRLSQAPALHLIHALLGYLPPWAMPGPNSTWINAPLGSPPLRPCQAPALSETAASLPHQERWPQALPDPSPAGIPTPQATTGPSSAPDTWPTRIPSSQAPPDAHSTGIPTHWAQVPVPHDSCIPAPLGSPPLGLGTSSTSLPDNCSTRLLLRLPQEGSKPA